MMYRLRTTIKRAYFNHQVRSILATPPLSMVEAPLRIVSMVSHNDLVMYLIAIKSFYRHLGHGVVTPLNDGSLTAEDMELLRRHIPRIDLREIASVDTAPCQRGGCWERLTLIADLCRDAYVIQLDSDTVTTAPIPEVEAQIAAGVSFTMLGGGSAECIETFAEASRRANASPNHSGHVQAVVERGMNRLLGHENDRYIRGNAAFAGFARGSFDRARIHTFSELMSSICGPEKWTEWGSEQVTSNLVVANTGGTFLPPHRYAGYYPEHAIDFERECALIHFIGLHRFENGLYARMALKEIAELNTAR